MKVNEVVKSMDGIRNDTLVKFFDKREDEVFQLSELSERLRCNKERLKPQLYKLVAEDRIAKYVKHKALCLYGSKKAIKSLEVEINERQKRF